MALKICDECGNKVSDRAASCPGCGNLIAAQTVEMTSKNLKKSLIRWNMFVVFSVVLCIFGFLITQGAQEDVRVLWAGVICLVVSLIGRIVSKSRIWWHHG